MFQSLYIVLANRDSNRGRKTIDQNDTSVKLLIRSHTRDYLSSIGIALFHNNNTTNNNYVNNSINLSLPHIANMSHNYLHKKPNPLPRIASNIIRTTS